MTALKTTPLHGRHTAAHANMADFGGYEMPLWYETGVKTEHLAVLTSAGIFDTSHMAVISLTGKGAFDLIQACFTRDIRSLVPGRCVYGLFLNDLGHCMDDAIVYKMADTRFMICVNAGMGGAIATHLTANQLGLDVDIRDLTGKVAKMDIQGKHSARILSGLLSDPSAVFSRFPYFSFKGGLDGDSEVKLTGGAPLLLSRSGYTGEFGFEIFIDPSDIGRLWDGILGNDSGCAVTPCGLGARDSLRAGAVLPLSHQDIGDWPFINTPWDFALPYTDDRKGFTKTFIGYKVILAGAEDQFTYPFAGRNLRKVQAGPETRVLDRDGRDIGEVLTCATDMGITRHDGQIVSIATPGLPENLKIKGIGCGFVKVNRPLDPGDSLKLTENRRSIDVEVVTDIRPDRTARKKITNFL